MKPMATKNRYRSARPRANATGGMTPAALRCRRKFLRFFPGGFDDETYIDWERDYKQNAHERWTTLLDQSTWSKLIHEEDYAEVARRAVTIESRTNLLFSFEKMALRDAVKSPVGARAFATGLYDYVHGRGDDKTRFEQWVSVVESLPRRQTRVLTWPLVTVFGFIARPESLLFLKPNVTRAAAREYQVEFRYESRPNWETYSSLVAFAEQVRAEQRDLRPKDMIDLQSFIWVQGSDEYEE
jgi:hypothetical protein